MAVDPVCGMEVDEKKTKYKKTVSGKTYYFCNEKCMKDFEKNKVVAGEHEHHAGH
ncbi:MAG TPA: YHS domain-containing protein, partial [archaeon]|nr:YHS domain-containing protein [archaeon]